MDKSKIQLELKFSRSSSCSCAFGFCLEGGSEFELGLHLCRLRRVGAPSQANAAIITRRRPGSRRLLWCAAETQDISITRVEQQLCLIATYRSFRETTRGFELQSSEHFQSPQFGGKDLGFQLATSFWKNQLRLELEPSHQAFDELQR